MDRVTFFKIRMLCAQIYTGIIISKHKMFIIRYLDPPHWTYYSTNLTFSNIGFRSAGGAMRSSFK